MEKDCGKIIANIKEDRKEEAVTLNVTGTKGFFELMELMMQAQHNVLLENGVNIFISNFLKNIKIKDKDGNTVVTLMRHDIDVADGYTVECNYDKSNPFVSNWLKTIKADSAHLNISGD